MNGRVIKRALLVSILVLLVSCRGQRERSMTGTSATTQTIAPAAAQPAPTGTDAMTQTVDVENGRSEEHGGTSGTTAMVAKPVKPAAKKIKKH